MKGKRSYKAFLIIHTYIIVYNFIFISCALYILSSRVILHQILKETVTSSSSSLLCSIFNIRCNQNSNAGKSGGGMFSVQYLLSSLDTYTDRSLATDKLQPAAHHLLENVQQPYVQHVSLYDLLNVIHFEMNHIQSASYC
jgi:hypothetical protein